MKRAKSRPLRGSERWQALGLFLFLASCIAFGMWIHFSHHEVAPPRELGVKAGPRLVFSWTRSPRAVHAS